MRPALRFGCSAIFLFVLVEACGGDDSNDSPAPSGVDAAADASVDAGVDAPFEDDVEAAPPAVCGDGAVGGAEDCDLGSDNGKEGFCCTDTCKFVARGTICRAAVNGCDPAEKCTGSGSLCPADAKTVDGAACSEHGGSTCCGAVCSHTATKGICDGCSIAARGPQRITIIESKSVNVAQDMDQHWLDVASAAGHTAAIAAQTTLDNIANLVDTDILIVSSGVAPLTAARQAVLDAFASSKRGLYLQGEYQKTYATNVTFAQIVNAHGATFAWDDTVSGSLDPMKIEGCLASAPEAAPTVTGYHYGCQGTGTATKVAVAYTAPGGQPVGWSFCLPGGGLVIHNTDQDFIRSFEGDVPKHMRNVLIRLADAAACK